MKTRFKRSAIVELRNSLNMSQLQFARAAGTSRQMLDKWEKGDCNPGIESLLKIINAFDVPISYFFISV